MTCGGIKAHAPPSHLANQIIVLSVKIGTPIHKVYKKKGWEVQKVKRGHNRGKPRRCAQMGWLAQLTVEDCFLVGCAPKLINKCTASMIYESLTRLTPGLEIANVVFSLTSDIHPTGLRWGRGEAEV